ncbi:MAG: tyrosine-type recombinase/integrase [bacterium]|nr:tyrosine-type recombinase/integrase [bacterium]
MNPSQKPILKHVPDFLDYCDVERGLSNRTQENYSRYLQRFSGWLSHIHREDLLPHELTAKDIWDYRVFLSRAIGPKGTQLTKATQNYYLIALRALLGYFVARDIQSIPPDKITLSKDSEKEKSVKFLGIEHMKKLLEAANGIDPASLRDRAIMEILFSTGMRIAEIMSLNVEQLDSIWNKEDYELGIIGKGSRPRTVYFSSRALSWLKKYLKTRGDKQKALFISYRGRSQENNRLTTRSAERIIKRYAIKAGVPLFTTPHTLRHSYATDLLSQGVDLRTIQEFLGHKNIVTTQVYTHVTNKQLRDVHKKFHGKNLE